MSEFEFVDDLPPTGPIGGARRGPDKVLGKFAAALRANPGRWARWPKPMTVSSARQIRPLIRRGAYLALPSVEFEGTCRQGVAYVRYVGEERAGA